MTRVLLIGGSPATRLIVRQILEAERDIAVVRDLAEITDALRILLEAEPELVVIDVSVLSTAGLKLIEAIMSERPLPIAILAEVAFDPENAAVTQAMHRGALGVHALPALSDRQGCTALRAAVRLFAKTPVVCHPRGRQAASSARPAATTGRIPAVSPPHVAEVVGIGSSAGGPAILADILGKLPKSYPACVLVVQHLPKGFAGPFAAFLRARVQLPVLVAAEPLPIAPGRIILAPDDSHLVAMNRSQCAGSSVPPVNGHRPSVDLLFESIAKTHGAAAVGVVLSGIGSDGTAGLRAIREQGGLTIAQDAQSAAVNGMPRAASESGAAALSLPPSAIAQVLIESCMLSARGEHSAD